MSEEKEFHYDSYAKIAAAFIEGIPSCRVIYGYDQKEGRYVLSLNNTGLYLRDIRACLPGHFELKYSDTQDTIIIIDNYHE